MATIWFMILVGVIAFVAGVIIDRKFFTKKS
jgi:cytochrome b subunit of formate dehydrogenase